MASAYGLDRQGAEVPSAQFLAHLKVLNQLVDDSGEPIEGNLFYMQATTDLVDRPPDPRRTHKRRNVHMILRHKPDFLEVGMNAGHSALLALSSNPRLRYFGIDIGTHTYVRPCAEYLKASFPRRVEYLIADSRQAMPQLIAKGSRFTCIHVDGGHTAEVCKADLANAIALAAPGSHLILDDVGAMLISDIYNGFVANGHFVTESLGGRWEKRENLLARIMLDSAPPAAAPDRRPRHEVGRPLRHKVGRALRRLGLRS